MFQREIVLNRFLVASLQRVMEDIPRDQLRAPGPGNGHPPLWVLGHLGVVGEGAFKVTGGTPLHPEWGPIFGPGSQDQVAQPERFDRMDWVDWIAKTYRQLQDRVNQVPELVLAKPHGLKILDDSGIETVGDLLAHILTSHFSFHLSQISAWRRAAGHRFLF